MERFGPKENVMSGEKNETLLHIELFLDAHASIQQNDELFNPVLHNMAASSEMLGLVTLTELLNEEGDFIQKHIAKFVVTACALQIYKCKLK